MLSLLLMVSLLSQYTPSWLAIGSRPIGKETDWSSITVVDSRNNFHRVKITVRGSTVHFHRVVFYFEDGEQQESTLHELVPDGGDTRTIHLQGAHGAIRRVDFWYDAKTVRSKGALVQLLAHD